MTKNEMYTYITYAVRRALKLRYPDFVVSQGNEYCRGDKECRTGIYVGEGDRTLLLEFWSEEDSDAPDTIVMVYTDISLGETGDDTDVDAHELTNDVTETYEWLDLILDKGLDYLMKEREEI